jgi:endonuclease/exonuclease/phosphatase (EEP) superfamily protein YafD
MSEEPLFEPSYEEHRRAQRLRWAKETTPAQRLAWLEAALEFVYASGIDYLAQKEKARRPPTD